MFFMNHKMIFKVYAGPLGHTYAQLYQYCGSLICIGLGLPPPKLLGSTERTHQAWPKSSEIHQYDQHISTVTNVSPTCHLSFVWLIDHLFVPRSHRTLANSLARLHADCLDGEPPGLLKDFQMISVFKTSVGWVLFWGIIPTIFLGGWSEFHCGNPGEPTNGMIEWSIEHQHWPIHGANQHANWDLSKPWALSHVDRGCVDA
jgi:hypothetical protein